MSDQLDLFAAEPERPGTPDAAARAFSVDPRNNVVLEASAGTGKTSVLVARYVNLLKAGVDPQNILAITFTRKAAAEMRERIVRELRESAARSEFDKSRWNALRDRLGEIAISTIDAFCLSLLREFPLEADLDPGFDMADETEVPRLVEEALDGALRIFGGLARRDPDVALVLAQLGVSRVRDGLAVLLERRLVAWDALDRFLARGPADLTAGAACRRAAAELHDALHAIPGGLDRFLASGPVHHARYQLLLRDFEHFTRTDDHGDSALRALVDKLAAHFLTQDGTARRSGQIPPYRAADYPSADAAKRHRSAVFQAAPAIERIVFAFARDLNVVLARGIRRMFAIALAQYRQALEERSLLDFSDVLQRALDLLRRMDEFSQSRFRLESRYHHVLVDEFQDTSRAQWDLVSLLIQSWGEGLGVAGEPSIFIVGDRKQSIYRFRDAEVAVLTEAARRIEALRPAQDVRRSISHSFRAVPELLDFVNDLFAQIAQPASRPDDFTYEDTDRFPIDAPAAPLRGAVLGVNAADDPAVCAAAVASEIDRILREDTVRDRKSGVPRPARPGDIAILFRSRASHREFERELTARHIPAYVYKGLGFFDADEIKDVSALLRYLANPASDLRAAAFLRSRFVRISDRALAILAPGLAAAILDREPPDSTARLGDEDRGVLDMLRRHVPGWVERVDRMAPADLLEHLLTTTAYAYELAGPRRAQARENLKKMRALVRRIQNRGYATMARIADHIDSLTAGDESNAVIEALDAVNLMTVHAAKGLEFPVVFVVNLAKGASGPSRPVRVVADAGGGEPSVSVGPFVSESDEAEREREKHETKRLLYVAVTRARDRLYLSSALKDGVFQPGRGSLGEVLPPALRDLFARARTAAADETVVRWTSGSGRTFEWRLCRAAQPDAPPRLTAADAPREVPVIPPLQELAAATSRSSVTRWLDAAGSTRRNGAGTRHDPVAGILVHRLFQHAGERQDSAGLDEATVLTLLTNEERTLLADPRATAREALHAWQAIRIQPEIIALFQSGTRLHEVPFSLRIQSDDGPVILRGAIDCLVDQAGGSIVVVEFKTGRPAPSHGRQLDLYIRAARALFPGRSVRGMLVYPDGTATRPAVSP